MLLEFIRNGFTPEGFIELGLYVIVILISLSIHELMHGYVAYRCGDATARNLGRLTLNPLAHLDPIGTIMMLVFGFGYAKPVPVNSRNFNHFKRDLCFVSFAGPFSNLCLSFIGAILYTFSFYFTFLSQSPAVPFWMFFCRSLMVANASLMVFNLLPIPPLDGSRIVSTLLPGRYAYYYLKYERYIMLLMFVLLYVGVLDGVLSFLVEHVVSGLLFVTNKIALPIVKLVY